MTSRMRDQLMVAALVGIVLAAGCNGKSDETCAGCGGVPSRGGGGAGGIAGAGGAESGGSNGGASVTGAGGTSAGGSGGTSAGGSGGTNAAGSGGALAGAGGMAAGCGVAAAATPLAPDILILLDRSGSMANDVNDLSCQATDPITGAATTDCGPSSKWALTTPVIDQVVAASESSVNFGLKFFADPGNNSCSVSNGVQVALGPHNAAAVTAAIAAETNDRGSITNGSRTPTRAAVQAAAVYLQSVADPSPKYILLATDGQPNCTPGGTNAAADDSAGAIAAVQAAAMAGIQTFVVGIATAGMGAADATLTAMALMGGVPRMGTPAYYPVSTPEELAAAIETLVGVSQQPCAFVVPPPPTQNGTTSRDEIIVYADGVQLPHDRTGATGWDYGDVTHTAITIYGTACAGLQSHAVAAISIAFRCLGGP